MQQIANLTDDANQTTHVVLPDGSIVDINLIYIGTVQMWMYSVTHPLLTVTGRVLCNHPNNLRNWKNIIPFGLGCLVNDGSEPLLQNDFISGRVTLYILDEDEVQAVEGGITQYVPA